MSTNLVTTAAVCAALGYKDRSSVTRLVAEGKLTPALKMEGRTGAYLFDADDIARFKAAREAAA